MPAKFLLHTSMADLPGHPFADFLKLIGDVLVRATMLDHRRLSWMPILFK